ncbi:BON domain-containing protein [Neorhodopirellula pilleata]|uniref:BON domain-containing protein n=1 Tax=Neorhodopirellula pilleata TaxID=2714738 RepID=UPI0011B5B5F3|nr:BON domain-containing protein [Neorhodopirellula pilleata]
MSVFVAAALLAGSAEANNQSGNTRQTDSTATGGTGTGMGNLSISEGFQVERTGTVGESTSTPVGANAASAAAQSTGGTTAGRSGGLGGFGGGGGGLGAAFGNLFGNSNSQSSNNSTPPIRTRLRAAVDLSPSIGTNPTISGVTATSRLRQSSTLQPGGVYGGVSGGRYNGVAIQMQGRTAVLTGQVRTEADRRMSHLMMRLEPGVSEVQNRIELSPGR